MKTVFITLCTILGARILNDTMRKRIGLQDLYQYGKAAAQHLVFIGLISLMAIGVKYLSRDGATERQKEQALILAVLLMGLVAVDLWSKSKKKEKELGAAM